MLAEISDTWMGLLASVVMIALMYLASCFYTWRTLRFQRRCFRVMQTQLKAIEQKELILAGGSCCYSQVEINRYLYQQGATPMEIRDAVFRHLLSCSLCRYRWEQSGVPSLPNPPMREILTRAERSLRLAPKVNPGP